MTALRAEIEDFLYEEAELLDGWALDRWADLFTADGEYVVPAPGEGEAGPLDSLYLVYDDRNRLKARTVRLLKQTAHAEFPRSVVRRILGNVRASDLGEARIRACCNFAVYRTRRGMTDVYPGHSTYELRRSETGGLRIRLKRAVLDLGSLRGHGTLSIIL